MISINKAKKVYDYLSIKSGAGTKDLPWETEIKPEWIDEYSKLFTGGINMRTIEKNGEIFFLSEEEYKTMNGDDNA